MYRDQTLSSVLAYLGALPFWLLVLGRLVGVDPIWAASAFIAYGTGIACFMAGTIWSQAQIKAPLAGGYLLVSNAAALAAIAALLLHSKAPILALLLQAATFVVLLVADHRLWRSGNQPAWYFNLRRNVTVLVVLAYGLAAAA